MREMAELFEKHLDSTRWRERFESKGNRLHYKEKGGSTFGDFTYWYGRLTIGLEPEGPYVKYDLGHRPSRGEKELVKITQSVLNIIRKRKKGRK